MKVVFDTNIYIDFIRSGRYSDLLYENKTLKYLPPTVLSELWAGAKSKQAERTISQLQKPYQQHNRIIEHTPNMSIALGQFLCDLPKSKKDLIVKSSFINDIRVALEASSIGAVLFTRNKSDFQLIKSRMKKLSVEFVGQ
jgi:predicted nucleic acid-binding protein